MVFRYNLNTENRISALQRLSAQQAFKARQASAKRFAMTIKAIQLVGLGIAVTLGSILIANIRAIIVAMLY